MSPIENAKGLRTAISHADASTPELDRIPLGQEPVIIIGPDGVRYQIETVNGVGGEIQMLLSPEPVPDFWDVSRLRDLMLGSYGNRRVEIEVEGKRYGVVLATYDRSTNTLDGPITLKTEEIR